MSHLLRSAILADAQHGFVPRRSCLTYLLLTEQWTTQIIDAHESVDVVFFDYSKALDSVNYRLPCVKLRALGVHVKVVEWMQSFPARRSFRVRVHDCLSSPFPASSGVPQGSVLGPLLFLLFVNDLPDLLKGKIPLFADDVKIIFPRSQYDNTELSLCTAWDWSVKWDLPLNLDKCCHLPIGQPPIAPLTFADGKSVGIVESASFPYLQKDISTHRRSSDSVQLQGSLRCQLVLHLP